MVIGSLFTGAGGLDLAVEWVLGGHTVWQVEQDPAARCVLARHWPDADRSCTDVRQARGLAPVDVIIGGFPCQDLSVAGSGKGLVDGERSGLFFALAGVIKEQQPDLVVIENVPALERWREVVEHELAGYACRWVRWSATSAGAPHLRRRVLVVATRGGSARPDIDVVVTPEKWAARQAELWPTPSASNPNDGETLASWCTRRDRIVAQGSRPLSPPLAVAVRAAQEGVSLWPTPSVKGNHNRAGASARSGDGLATAVKQASLWPTLAASDYRTAGPGQRRGQLGEAVGPPYRLAADWVECLMGWPVGWTRADGPSQREQAEALLKAPCWPRGRPPKEHEGPWLGHAWEPLRTRGGPPVRGRPGRLRMCGNGVVPQAAAMALRAALARQGGE